MALDGLNDLFVANFSNNTVGEFNATTGATINATFINNTQGLSGPAGISLDGNNHLFVANFSNNTIGEFNATTGATINATFVNNTQGLNSPDAMIFVPAPGPGTISLVLVAGGVAFLPHIRRRFSRQSV